MDLAMRIGLSFLSFSALGALALSAPAFGAPNLIGQTDDGTYRTETVYSTSECSAICQAESPLCRGTITVQMDITKPEMICRLNNGKGAQPAFPSTPPTPLNRDIALADFNAYRAEVGLDPVKYSGKLNEASRLHAEDMARAGDASHSGTDGSSHGDRVQRQAYYFTIAAENVASGQKSWEKVFKAWQDSPGHNENLLRDDVTDFGVALVYDPDSAYQTYWAMLVAAPLDADTTEYLRYQGQIPPMATSGAELKSDINP
ncbi:CAP domain-containing protein [Hellea balneolensis]|uniref:CAP domain-containing protein n=1 Tax=Hellea balneolensis TaxID=287478 RepID=UPI0004261809|nr:CAP domain-containing protein [Hellea balneolensis]